MRLATMPSTGARTTVRLSATCACSTRKRAAVDFGVLVQRQARDQDVVGLVRPLAARKLASAWA